MPNVSKFRATKPKTAGADVHIRVGQKAEVARSRARDVELIPAADSAYDSAETLGWLLNEHAIEPHIPVFDKSARDDGTFCREDFAYDLEHDLYVCPAGKVLSSTGTPVNDAATLLYRAAKHNCDACELKPRCCPKMPGRKVPRSIHERARNVRATSQRPIPMSGRG
jgi:hypothetical protein